jgi:uncharacterized protein (DUF433 family)
MAVLLNTQLPAFLHEQDGEIRLVGHRISIVDILQFYRDGYTPEMLAARYETLNLAQIHYVIAFYHEHQPAMDAYLNDYLAECDRSRQGASKSPGYQNLRQRLLAMRKAQRKAAHAS